MGFLEAVRTCLFRKYADFQGRASRAEYWWFALFSLVVPVVAFNSGPRFPGLLVTGVVVMLLTAVPHLAVTVRRLHDTGRSGWWLLLGPVGRIPGVGWIASLVLLWFLIQRGDAGGNRYGPNPVPDAVLGLSRAGGSPSHNHD